MDMNYIENSDPSSQTFTPFSDSASLTNFDHSFCGPKQYIIIEVYSFINLIPPAIDNNIDPWTIEVSTHDFFDIGFYTVTLKITLVNYPSVNPLFLPFRLSILHPCSQTKFIPVEIPTMEFTIGDVDNLSNFFN